ncbi:hypothetical protein BXT86_03660 [candidate division WOR-3 bacterium 4484_100]|uniref:Uncharacterized protein n=1 Tax=candidate division WOR-3 bacterium 4484_100 TaxID=1936077 RepID=A0A1V4QG35_UNCW3|nr:MAG: hypothetical protein BXT86_03660 [candidate division WOR-3 bacterium 4484_100]
MLMFLFLACPSPLLNTARIAYFNQKDFPRAKNACLEGIKTEPNNFEYYTILGGCEIALANWIPAAKALVQGFEADSAKAMEWIKKQKEGIKYYYQGFYYGGQQSFEAEKYDDALKYLRYAKMLNPDDARAYILIATIKNKEGDKEAAKKEWQSALRIDPENPDVHFLIGDVLFTAQAYDSSLKYFNMAEKYYNRKYDRVTKILFQNVPELKEKLVPEIIRLWSAKKYDELDNLIKIKLGLEKGFRTLKRNIEQLYKITDGLSKCYYYTGLAYYNLKKDSLALKYLKKTLLYKPDDIDALYFSGEIELVTFKNYSQAMEHFKRITELKEDDFGAWYYYGVCHYHQKKYKKAIEILEDQVLTRDPKNINAMTYLADAYRQIGNKKKALEYLMKSEQLQKEKK